MIEYYTEALVLGKEDVNEADGLVYFYTKDLGKVIGKAKGVRKMTSKLNAHLEPFNFVNVRLVSGRNHYFQIADALSFKTDLTKKIKKSPQNLSIFLRIIDFIKEATFELQPDFNLWQTINKMVSSDIKETSAFRLILKELGFDPEFAECGLCRNKNIVYFLKKDQIFLCEKCGHSSKIPENELILINPVRDLAM